MQGQLFTQDFLADGIRLTEPYRRLDDPAVDALAAALRGVFAGVAGESALNEAQTEQQLLRPVLARLGWGAGMPQVNASGRGRESVPDLLLFPDEAACGSYRTKALVLAYMAGLDAGDAVGLGSPGP